MNREQPTFHLPTKRFMPLPSNCEPGTSLSSISHTRWCCSNAAIMLSALPGHFSKRPNHITIGKGGQTSAARRSSLEFGLCSEVSDSVDVVIQTRHFAIFDTHVSGFATLCPLFHSHRNGIFLGGSSGWREHVE